MINNSNRNLKGQPVVFFIFGATGDLAAKKIIPALFNLYVKKTLPKDFKVIGFARKDYGGEKFSAYVEEIVKKRIGKHTMQKDLKNFSKLFEYHQGQLSDPQSYASLANNIKSADDNNGIFSYKLFYLSVAPEFYEPVLKNISSSGLASVSGKINSPSSKTDKEGNFSRKKVSFPAKSEGLSRIIIEKPFGDSLKSAKKIESLIGGLFKEEQIYRIDHYLGKEMLQNILAFRFANNLFENSWNSKTIESIHIRLLEDVGVEHRGAFYDAVGAFRDVGQNHLLEALALVTMDRPKRYDADSIIKNRLKVLEALVPPLAKNIHLSAFRAQYKGYGKIDGVKPDSRTETYFKVKASLALPGWKGVPVILEGGKRMGESLKDIVVTFKPVPPISGLSQSACQNEIIFQWEPEERIKIKFCSKKPSQKMELNERNFDFFYRGASERVQYVEEYEKLISDCLAGDQTLFISAPEIYAMWKFADTVVKAWGKNLVPLHAYEPGGKEFFLP